MLVEGMGCRVCVNGTVGFRSQLRGCCCGVLVSKGEDTGCSYTPFFQDLVLRDPKKRVRKFLESLLVPTLLQIFL